MYKTITAILALAYAATAATLPSGLAVGASLPYPRAEMEWTGIVVNGSEPMTLYGSIENVFEQARKINPDFQFQGAGEADEADELETRELEKRNRAHIICNIGGRRSGFSTYDGAKSQYRYLKGLDDSCGVSARRCTRVSCENGNAVWLCNDNNHRIAPKCRYLAGYVENIVKECNHKSLSGTCRGQGCNARDNFLDKINGQQFDTDNYNVIVGGDNC